MRVPSILRVSEESEKSVKGSRIKVDPSSCQDKKKNGLNVQMSSESILFERKSKVGINEM